jgi:hypothetical protein
VKMQNDEFSGCFADPRREERREEGQKEGTEDEEELDLTSEITPTGDVSLYVASIKSELTFVHPQSSFEHHSGDISEMGTDGVAGASKTAPLSEASPASEVSFCSHLKLK